MGQAYRKLKDYEKAISSFRCVLELDPKNSEAYSALGVCLMMSDRKEEAILAFHEVCLYSDSDSPGWYWG